MTTDERLKQIAEAAAKVAPGEWEADSVDSEGAHGRFSAYNVTCAAPNPYAKRPWSAIVDTHNSEIICEHEEHDEDGTHRWDENGRVVCDHIATFDPPTVLTLLSDKAALEAEVDEVNTEATVLLTRALAAKARATALEARELVLVEALKEARDLLLERIQGSHARSAAHNARLVIVAALSAQDPANG